MTRRRYELTDHEWSILSRCCPTNRVVFPASMIGGC